MLSFWHTTAPGAKRSAVFRRSHATIAFWALLSVQSPFRSLS